MVGQRSFNTVCRPGPALPHSTLHPALLIVHLPSTKLRPLAQLDDETTAWTQADLELNSTSAAIRCVTLVKSPALSKLHCSCLFLKGGYINYLIGLVAK